MGRRHTGLDSGNSIKVKDISVPEDIAVLDPPDVGVAMVAVVKVSVPQAEEAAAAEGEAAAEGAPAAEGETPAKGDAKG